MKYKVEKWVLTAAVMICAFLGVPSHAQAATLIDLPITVEEDYTKAQELLKIINNYRESLNPKLEPYILDEAATEYAMQRATECAVMGYHLRPNSLNSATDGYDEDLAAGYGTAQLVFDAWMSDAGHRRPIINPLKNPEFTYKYVGIGCVVYNNTIYWSFNPDMKSENYNGKPAPTGKQMKSRVIQWSLDMDKKFWPKFVVNRGGTVIAGDMNGSFSSNIYIQDPYVNIMPEDGKNPGLGYKVPASLVNISVADPSIAGVVTDAEGCIRPIGFKPGSTTITVTLKQNASVSTAIPITVKPQVGSGNAADDDKTYTFTFALPTTVYDYTGQPIEPKLSVAKDWFGNDLVEGRDYRLTYENNIQPGTATVKIWMIGDYQDPDDPNGIFFAKKFNFLIIAQDPQPDTDNNQGGNEPETGTETPDTQPDNQEPENPGQETLPPEPNETQPQPETPSPSTPSEPQNPSTPGETNPGGSSQPGNTAPPQTEPPKQTEAPKPVGTMGVTVSSSSVVYSGKAQTPAVTVTFNGQALGANYYTVSYQNNVEVGTAAVVVTGQGEYSGFSARTTFQITARKIKVKLSETSLTYNGKSRKPTVRVYYNSKKISSKYYSVSYESNKKPGIATVTVTGKGAYKYSSASTTFKIKPKAPKLSSVRSSSKKKLTVKWKPATGASGHQVQYAASKSFSGAKTKTVSGSSKSSLSVSSLKSGKTYYVRVRAYKTVNGEKIYGSWCSKDKVKVK